MRLIDGDDDFLVDSVQSFVVPVLDDLVLKPFEHEQHLGVCGRVVLVGKEPLEIEGDEILPRRKRRISVP